MPPLRHVAAKRFSFVASLFLTGLALNGCFLSSKNNSPNAAKIIHRDTILFDRLGSGDSARVAFKTESSANCEISYWQQKTKSSSDKKSRPCKGVAQTNFVEPIEGLSAGALYTFEIRAWKITSNPTSADSVTIDENEGKGLGKSLIVVRLNRPLYLAQIHRFSQDAALDLAELRTELAPAEGCKSGVLKSANGLSKASKLELSNITSLGYASSSAAKHPQLEERLFSQFELYQNESRWQWKYEEEGREQDFLTRQTAELHHVEISSSQTRQFDLASLSRPENIIDVDSSKPLVFRWSSNNLADLSYISVQIGNASTRGSFYCVFDARKDAGTIAANSPLLKKTEKGVRYDLVVSLVSSQIQLFPGAERTPWALTSYDWRSAVLNRI